MKVKVDLIISGAEQLLTFSGPAAPRRGEEMADPVVIEKGALAVCRGLIVAVGSTEEILKHYEVGDEGIHYPVPGRVVMPCFVDPHTHLVYGGTREGEFMQRLQGADYLEILAAGGGILNTVQATRAASEEELYARGERLLNIFLQHGVGTVEAKSGYGLDTATELKQLHLTRRLDQGHPVDIVPTFLGAHAFPPEYSHDHDAYVDLVVEEMLPRVAAENLAQYCDVFCEKGVFSIAQSRKVLLAARALGLEPKIHADEIVSFGGAELAAEVGALTADHLLRVSPEGIAGMVRAGVIAVLLPGTAFFLMKKAYAPARKLIAEGLAVALSTDCNPGSSPTQAINLILTLACLEMKMTPAEVLCAVTINAAYALGRGDRVGSLEPGKEADIIVVDAPNYNYIPYHYGVNLVEKVFKKGVLVVG